ncbi:MAG: hypothetical protein IKC74_04585 [Clostridia bacterium]|nr:hypothetical protein [Clostridia bacterium]
MDNGNMSYNPLSRIQPYISYDENILWCGMPAVKQRFNVKDTPTFLFGIPFLAFAIFWTAMASSASSGGPIGTVFPLFGIPFIVVGIFMVFVLPYKTIKNRNNAVYAITDKRVYILYDNSKQSLISYERYRLSNITVEIKDGNVGNIRFQTGQYYETAGRRNRYGTVRASYDGFFGINDVQYVFRILNQ